MDNEHTPFLQQVARYYAAKRLGSALADYCFVFPNRRSSQFFGKYLEEDIVKNDTKRLQVLPCMTTISELVADLAGSTPASNVELLFLLHRAYTEVIGRDYPFDKFVYWGNVVLSDFNDVDMYLVDPKDIFTNIKEYHEISTDFLPQELKEDLKKYFNTPLEQDEAGDSERMWRSYETTESDENDEGSVKGQFVKLWHQLLPLYNRFNQLLRERKLSYTGMTYRQAACRIKEQGVQLLEHDRYVMVGFNVLSNCELAIFNRLRQAGVAHFYWDSSWPAMAREENLATRFIKIYRKHFPSPADFDEEVVSQWPEFNEVAVPSNFGQAKEAMKIVDRLIDDGTITARNTTKTAVVLPDEGLFTPVINSISSKVSSVNITIGYPLRSADVVSLMRCVARAHHTASKKQDEWQYYRDDVRNVISHPMVKAAYGEAALSISRLIDNSTSYNVPQKLLATTELAPLFATIDGNVNNKDNVAHYISNLIEWVEGVNDIIANSGKPVSDDDGGDSQSGDGQKPLQSVFIEQYTAVLRQMRQCIEQYGVPMTDASVFYLIDRLTGSYTIPFEGNPLNGIQIMGVLETRCLDFDNVIILSMNDRVFPRRHSSKSMIAQSVRHFFGMSSAEHRESMSSYYFYRLISRAKRVWMLYDSSTSKVGSGEPSRYITQLEKVYGCAINHTVLTGKLTPQKTYLLTAPKDDFALAQIKRFLPGPGGDKTLSASVINKFVDCPLRFYLYKLQELSDDTTKGDFMDAATLGSIVHDTLQELYYPDPEHSTGERVVTDKMIEDFKKTIDSKVSCNINKIYLRRGSDQLEAPLQGDALILKTTIRLLAENVLNYDLQLLKDNGTNYFVVMECERDEKCVLDFGNGVKFNFYYRMDRVDRIGSSSTVRIVDYKTGSDATVFANVKKLFTVTKNALQRPHAVLQLYLYSMAWLQEHDKVPGMKGVKVQPVIYKLRNMAETGVKKGSESNPKSAVQVELWHDGCEELDEFKQEFSAAISPLFSPDAGFEQADEGSTYCNYCRFIDLCKRVPKEY